MDLDQCEKFAALTTDFKSHCKAEHEVFDRYNKEWLEYAKGSAMTSTKPFKM